MDRGEHGRLVDIELDESIGRATPDVEHERAVAIFDLIEDCLLYTSPSPRDRQKSRMPSSA